LIDYQGNQMSSSNGSRRTGRGTYRNFPALRLDEEKAAIKGAKKGGHEGRQRSLLYPLAEDYLM